MTVAELIAELAKMPPDAAVIYAGMFEQDSEWCDTDEVRLNQKARWGDARGKYRHGPAVEVV